MAEYIERNSAVALLRERGLEAGEKIGPVFANGIFDAVRFLGSFPTADVAPVVHGTWEGDTCTHCKLPWNYNMVQNGDDWGYFSPMPDFCPNCGAKMDKEVDDAQ